MGAVRAVGVGRCAAPGGSRPRCRHGGAGVRRHPPARRRRRELLGGVAGGNGHRGGTAPAARHHHPGGVAGDRRSRRVAQAGHGAGRGCAGRRDSGHPSGRSLALHQRCGAHDAVADARPGSRRNRQSAGRRRRARSGWSPWPRSETARWRRSRRIVDAGVVAAVGHTDATYEQTRAAIDAGATVGDAPVQRDAPDPPPRTRPDHRAAGGLAGDRRADHRRCARRSRAVPPRDQAAQVQTGWR